MREYKWSKGHWLSDGHLWALLLDIPKMPREDTGERVMLMLPTWLSREGFTNMPPVECKIFYVPKANIYIAIGEKANGYLDVLFFDKISYKAEADKRIPGGKWADYENWCRSDTGYGKELVWHDTWRCCSHCAVLIPSLQWGLPPLTPL